MAAWDEILGELNHKFREDIFPSDWKNSVAAPKYDLLVIGGGPGGMTAAITAKNLGATVAIIEKEHFGGECLSYGCIPSKAFLRSSGVANDIRNAKKFGFEIPNAWRVDFGAVVSRVRRLQATLSPHDSPYLFRKMGIDPFLGTGQFVGPNQVEVEGQIINFSKALIVTGTQPIALNIPGLGESDYQTNQTIFGLKMLPKRLGVIGGGPISCELAQAFLRFGSQVTLITHDSHLLPKDDKTATDRLKKVFEKEGMLVLTQTKVIRVEKKGREKILHLDKSDQEIVVDEILVAIGRAPAVDTLNLEAANISYDPHKGITTNEFLQTTNANIYAAGDVTSKYKFTHMSKELSKLAVMNALKGHKDKKSALNVPWCTFTEPEVAHIGLHPEEASEQGIATEMVMIEMASIDRAVVDEQTVGFMRLLVKEDSNQILGADIMASHAGDMIGTLSTAMAVENGLLALANAIQPFPTQAEVIRAAAESLLKKRESLVKT